MPIVKICLFLITGVLLLFFDVFSRSVTRQPLSLLTKEKVNYKTIDLTKPEKSACEKVRVVHGGRFTERGWKALDHNDRIRIQLIDSFGANASGAVELDVYNFNPKVQATATKQHFFSLYGLQNPDSDTFKIEGPHPYFNLRVGKNKYADGYGIKVLWSPKGKESRQEVGPLAVQPNPPGWLTNQLYTWRVEWNADSIRYFLNGKLYFGPVFFGQRIKPMDYIMIGADRDSDVFKESKSLTGCFYQRVRIYQ